MAHDRLLYWPLTLLSLIRRGPADGRHVAARGAPASPAPFWRRARALLWDAPRARGHASAPALVASVASARVARCARPARAQDQLSSPR